MHNITRKKLISLLESAGTVLMGIGGIDFPKEEYASLKGRDIIVTHRVSDEYSRYRQEDFLRMPWGDIYKCIYRMNIRDVKDSPYYDKLTPAQKKELSSYDRIAVLWLRRNQKRHVTDEDIERIYKEVVRDYKKHYKFDLSGINLIISEVPTYTEGRPAPKMIGLSAGNLVRAKRSVIINPYPEIPMRAYNVRSTDYEKFVYLICAHELAHAIDAFGMAPDLVKEYVKKAKEEGFTTGYLKSYGKNVPDKEIFAEYMTKEMVRRRG